MDIYDDFQLDDDDQNIDPNTNADSLSLADYALLTLSGDTGKPSTKQQKHYEEQIVSLKNELKDMADKMKELLAMNDKKDNIILVLKRNISSLFKTAKLELERREKQLNDERAQNTEFRKIIAASNQKPAVIQEVIPSSHVRTNDDSSSKSREARVHLN